MASLYTYTNAQNYFNDFIGKVKNEKIKAIFSLDADSLEVVFRELTMSELKKYEILKNKECSVGDFFNDVTFVYDPVSEERYCREISLEYGSVSEIQLSPVTEDYWKWEKGELVHAWPTEETFNDITFIMDNGKKVVICAGDELDDGACWVCSEDAVETVQIKN